ncbi:MAG TPA: hypothetical protein VNH64_04305 [Parvularculaceae bacterium]|nr:hypothetical protein [Parvularculaceae bacterium]
MSARVIALKQPPFDASSFETPRAVRRATPEGRIFSLAGGPGRVPCFYFAPPGRDLTRPPLVVVHGISRNALEQIARFAPAAARRGVALIAPLFIKAQFRAYQTLGDKDGWRALKAFEACLAAAQDVIGQSTTAVNIFGYSGGGQFAHRFAMMRPQRVKDIAVAAAGWYTMPDPTMRYPYGIGGVLSPISDIGSFYKRRALVIVGEGDRQRDPALRRSRRLDREQGRDRVERARNWTRAVNHAAEAKGARAPAAFVALPSVGHSFSDCADAGLAQFVTDWFYPRSRDQEHPPSIEGTEICSDA